MALSGLALFVLAVYLGAIVAMSFAFARRQRSGEEYFLAGRTMSAGVLAASILANQASAVSLVGAPAFVALRAGGGLVWLQYELAVPLSMILIIAFLLPALRSVPGSSIYVYAESRFGRGTRRALASAFLLSRGLALGVVLYASSLVVAEATGWPLLTTLLLVGAFAAAYTGLGGIVADIWSDVLQLALLWGGTAICAGVLLLDRGRSILESVPRERMRTLVLDSAGLTDGSPFSFWPMLIGGLFLYAAYYGCDQSQAQRLLTARSDGEARRALFWNGILRFPLVLTYCGFGLLLSGLLRLDPEFAQSMAGRAPDSLVPVFLTTYLPSGLRGLMLAAILAAAMSSIDSALNSLAAVTLEDAFGLAPGRQGIWIPRLTTLCWGLFAVGSGLVFARAGSGVIVLINQVGSAFYGPILAVLRSASSRRGSTGEERFLVSAPGSPGTCSWQGSRPSSPGSGGIPRDSR
jgi:SSS family solute:Na+ symporter